MKRFMLVCTALMLAACAPSEPVVAAFNGDSVSIQQYNFAGEGARSAATDAEATRICNKGGRKTAEYASVRVLPNYYLEHLYLCL